MPITLPPEDPDRRFGRPPDGWRLAVYRVIFESDTRAGRAFDLVLIGLILASVAVVMADSVAPIAQRFGALFTVLEWGFTAAFTAEYLLRLVCVQRPLRYARSGFGIIDLLAIAPTYLALLFPALHALIDVRVLRLLRIFRILKLTAYVAEFGALGRALWASRRKVLVFLSFVLGVVLVMGTLMYVVEGPANGFTSVPVAVYWAITTMTTVGFGDITPKTDLGRLIASIMMLLGWGTLAVPTGIVSAEFTAQRLTPGGAAPSDPQAGSPTESSAGSPAGSPTGPGQGRGARECDACGCIGHAASARYCRDCGALLPDGPDGPDWPDVPG